jgi:hypothetical protein
VAVATPHVAFQDLSFDHVEAPSASNEVRNRVDLLAPDMIELQHTEVEIAAIDATGCEVGDDDLPRLDESPRARRTHVDGVARRILPIVSLLALAAV